MGSEHSYLREITLPYPRKRKELLLGREKGFVHAEVDDKKIMM